MGMGLLEEVYVELLVRLVQLVVTIILPGFRLSIVPACIDYFLLDSPSTIFFVLFALAFFRYAYVRTYT